ncbi:hypothetical protein [Lysinibacillus sp. NPDC093216]|uniref:hypothetical protein n=1 Tax=Lysinibacillus sp. NPDC093216 TaxID=3390576 RepID=UPI003D00BD4D
MDKHTLRELMDISVHKEAIIRNVKIKINEEQSSPKRHRWSYRIVTLTITCSVLLFVALQLTKYDILKMTTDTSQIEGKEVSKQLTDLFNTEVKGSMVTYSQYFQTADRLNDRKNPKFYEPVKGFEAMQEVATVLGNNVHPIDPKKLPFKANIQEVYAVTSEMTNGRLQNQLQFTYLQKALSGKDQQFAIFTVTNVDSNPLANYDITHDISDFLGNTIKNEGLIGESPLFHPIATPGSGRLSYFYYDFDIKNKKVRLTSNEANELYTYYNGYVFHVGYQLEHADQEDMQKKMIELVKEFILGNDL